MWAWMFVCVCVHAHLWPRVFSFLFLCLKPKKTRINMLCFAKSFMRAVNTAQVFPYRLVLNAALPSPLPSLPCSAATSHSVMCLFFSNGLLVMGTRQTCGRTAALSTSQVPFSAKRHPQTVRTRISSLSCVFLQKSEQFFSFSSSFKLPESNVHDKTTSGVSLCKAGSKGAGFAISPIPSHAALLGLSVELSVWGKAGELYHKL